LRDSANPVRDGHATEFKAPWVYTKNARVGELKAFLKRRGNGYPPYTGITTAELKQSPSFRSLELLLKHLTTRQTRVVLVNMPLHPLLNALVPEERRRILRERLRSLESREVTVLDYQDKFENEDFIDLVHLNARGRRRFTEAMREFLIQQPWLRPDRTTTLTQAAHAL
jgi:poly-D-alanine transfer protein DltD